MCCLKVLRVAACLQLAERLVQSFAPLNEKDFLPFSVSFFGNLRSVAVLRSLYEVPCEFPNKLRKYGGASSFKLSKSHCFGLNFDQFIDSFPPQILDQLIAGGVKTTVCYNSSSPVLQVLQAISLSCTSTAPN